MKKKPIYINDLHFEHKLWKGQLTFEKDELNILKHRLEEVVQRWTDREVLAKAEHFQNQFILHNEVLDTLIHGIKEHENELVKFALEHPVAMDHVHFEDHGGLRDKVETQRALFSELKKEFMRFLTYVM